MIIAFIIIIIRLTGAVLILSFFGSLLNYYFGWHLGIKGEEIPADPMAAIAFLVLGIILSVIGYFWDKKASV